MAVVGYKEICSKCLAPLCWHVRYTQLRAGSETPSMTTHLRHHHHHHHRRRQYLVMVELGQLLTRPWITVQVHNNKQYRYISVLLLWSQIVLVCCFSGKCLMYRTVPVGCWGESYCWLMLGGVLGGKLLLIDVRWSVGGKVTADWFWLKIYTCVIIRGNMLYLCCWQHIE